MANTQTVIATDRGAVRLSTMSGKLQGIPAINTNTLSNEFCQRQYSREKSNSSAQSVCTDCYSVKMLSTFRKSCVPRFEEHSQVLSDRLLEPREIGRVFSDVLRINGHGELINDIHYRNICAIAEANPHTLVVLWTKRRDIIHRVHGVHGMSRPANLQLIYSNPLTNRVLQRVPKHFDKVFNVIAPDTKSPVPVNCYKACRDCMLCYSHNTTDIIVEELK